ncbi:MAG: hypothetical protein JWP12_2333 [Bacteroidetes bacterium]|nr:hypothetical protein [Bacteroidota bacterium]
MEANYVYRKHIVNTQLSFFILTDPKKSAFPFHTATTQILPPPLLTVPLSSSHEHKNTP